MVDLTKHAEAILRAARCTLQLEHFSAGERHAILTACAELADAVALEMREAAAQAVEEASGNAMTNGYNEAAEGMGDGAEIIRAIDPASLREGGV